MRIGILAFQGSFEAHAKMINRLGVQWVYVTHPKHLSGINGLILPGGESSTLLHFLKENDFFEALKLFAKAGRCLFGTCAGAILLAREVVNPTQKSLDLIDVTIERNAFGRQLASKIGMGRYQSQEKNLEMVFIRAPRIQRIGPNAVVFAQFEDQSVGIIQNRCMLTTFHPELTNDTTIHQLFLQKCDQQ